jgi:flagellar basal-body rod modification protein FlgD
MPTTIDSLATVSNSSTTKKAGSTDSSDRFLKLLVAQMKNQDPLNPLDNAQVTSQMAQISTVEGIDKLNDTMQSVLGQIQASQAASLVGREVLVDGANLAVDGLSPSRGGYSFLDGADRVEIEIRDSSGRALTTISQGATTAGPKLFVWDGKVDGKPVPAGNYTFAVTGTLAGRQVAADSFGADRVTSVIPGVAGASFGTAAGRSLQQSAIRAVL